MTVITRECETDLPHGWSKTEAGKKDVRENRALIFVPHSFIFIFDRHKSNEFLFLERNFYAEKGAVIFSLFFFLFHYP